MQALWVHTRPREHLPWRHQVGAKQPHNTQEARASRRDTWDKLGGDQKAGGLGSLMKNT